MFYKYPHMTQDGYYMVRDNDFHYDREGIGSFIYCEETDREFRDFLDRLSDDGIKVVLVMAPLHENFKFREGEIDRMEQYYDSISAEYGIPFYNCLSMEIMHDSTYFQDKGHLNLKGAKMFTDSLSHFLIDNGLFED
jgi:lysophospholipase L1-like esterase